MRKECIPLPRIAFLGGGIASVPAGKNLLLKLAKNYQITVFSDHGDHPLMPDPVITKRIRMPSRFVRLRDLQFLFLIAIEHMKNPFAFYHAHSTYPGGMAGMILKKNFKKKLLLTLVAAEASAVPEIKFGDILSPRRLKLNTAVIAAADYVVVLSNFHKNEVQNIFKVKNPISVIPFGADRNQFKHKNPHNIGRPVKLIAVSYLHPVKGIASLLEALRILNEQGDYHLTIAGKDYDNGEMMRLAKKWKIDTKINFCGFVPHLGIHELLKNADIFVHASLFESQCVSFCEAMACGIPVAATNTGLFSDLSQECCLTVKPGDSLALSKAIIKIVEEKNVREKLIENGLTWSRQNHADKCLEEYEKIYRNLLLDNN